MSKYKTNTKDTFRINTMVLKQLKKESYLRKMYNKLILQISLSEKSNKLEKRRTISIGLQNSWDVRVIKKL
jgi:hypothetical protein